jgi:hypothetical protein
MIPMIFRVFYGDSDGDGGCGLHERTEFWSFLGGPGEQVEKAEIRDGMERTTKTSVGCQPTRKILSSIGEGVSWSAM